MPTDAPTDLQKAAARSGFRLSKMPKKGADRKKPVRSHTDLLLRYATVPEVIAFCGYMRGLPSNADRASVLRIVEQTIQ